MRCVLVGVLALVSLIGAQAAEATQPSAAHHAYSALRADRSRDPQTYTRRQARGLHTAPTRRKSSIGKV